MAKLSELLERLPEVKAVHMSASGYALWIVWDGDSDPSVVQTLQDYGGMHIGTDRNQTLWFFFSIDVMLALAKLDVWGRFNTLSMGAQVLPARLLLSVSRAQTVSIDANLGAQEMSAPAALEILVHPKIREQASTIPGLSFGKSNLHQGMAAVDWGRLEADVRLPYTSTQGWYALVHPLGNHSDKAFATGWRYMFGRIDALIQQHKFKYAVHNNFAMVSLDNLRMLRLWVRELLDIMVDAKTQAPESYWPCVCVIVDRRGLNLNHELPNKVGIKWDQLVPDFPYLSYRNAYLLGKGFTLNELHFSSASATMDSWCTVGVGEGQTADDHVPVIMAAQLVAGNVPNCFYCGARNHSPAQCPTKHLKNDGRNIWREFGEVSLEEINEGFRTIDTILTSHGVEGYGALMGESKSAALLMEACFEINRPVQLRDLERMLANTAARRKEDFCGIQDNADTQVAVLDFRDDSPAWNLLDKFYRLAQVDLSKFEKDVQDSITKHPRDVRLRSLLGFVIMEQGGEPARALAAWKEAETLCSSSIQQAWHQFLQARLLEVSGRLVEAQEKYQAITRLAPQWREPEYRQIVCRVKMGFTEQVQQNVLHMADAVDTTFNRFLIDPELERGHLIILNTLFPIWTQTLRQASEERTQLQRLSMEVHNWFPEESPVTENFLSAIEQLLKLSGIENFSSLQRAIKSRPPLEKQITQHIQREVDQLHAKYQSFLTMLEIIRDEASWFPFPKALIEFNKNFNECAGIINWAFSVNFQESQSFKNAREQVPAITDLLRQLEKRLRFLRVVRDSTLFGLILLRSFFWVELVGVALCIITVPSIAMWGDLVGLGWLKALVREHHWELQKVLLTIVTTVALGLSVLRTTLIFEKRREKLLTDARIHRQQMQQQRLEAIRESKRIEREKEEQTRKKVRPFSMEES